MNVSANAAPALFISNTVRDSLARMRRAGIEQVGEPGEINLTRYSHQVAAAVREAVEAVAFEGRIKPGKNEVRVSFGFPHPYERYSAEMKIVVKETLAAVAAIIAREQQASGVTFIPYHLSPSANSYDGDRLSYVMRFTLPRA